MSKCNNLSLSTLQRARKELIDNDYITYRKGKNQNDASRYSIVKLYEENIVDQACEQALDQARDQACEQTLEHIITKLNLFYIYINNSNAESFEDIAIKDKIRIRAELKRLEVYIESDTEAERIIETSNRLTEFKIYYYAIKELYFSEERIFLRTITNETLMTIYQKSERYIYKERKRNNIRLFKLFYKKFKKHSVGGI